MFSSPHITSTLNDIDMISPLICAIRFPHQMIRFRFFTVELLAGTDIAVYMSARFGYTGDYQLVMNSLAGDQWGAESRHSNPFHIGAQFHLKIEAQPSHYKVDQSIINHNKNIILNNNNAKLISPFSSHDSDHRR